MLGYAKTEQFQQNWWVWGKKYFIIQKKRFQTTLTTHKMLFKNKTLAFYMFKYFFLLCFITLNKFN